MAVHAKILSCHIVLELSSHFSFPFSLDSAAGGEIFNQCVADNDEAFTEKDVIRLAKQILTGVAFLHRNNVVHLDLKVNMFTLQDYCLTCQNVEVMTLFSLAMHHHPPAIHYYFVNNLDED